MSGLDKGDGGKGVGGKTGFETRRILAVSARYERRGDIPALFVFQIFGGFGPQERGLSKAFDPSEVGYLSTTTEAVAADIEYVVSASIGNSMCNTRTPAMNERAVCLQERNSKYCLTVEGLQ